MKRLLIAVLAVGVLAAIAWAANGMAGGTGAIKVSERSNGQFTFTVNKKGDAVRGTLTFVELIPGRQATVLANINLKVERAVFDKNTATFAGKGILNRNPVFVQVKVSDNRTPTGATGDADFFSIVANAPDGTQVYGARGAVVRGDIKVKSGD